jgi:hypothetical protein
MKRILFLTLLVLTSVAMADDAKIKALLVGTWTADCGGETYILKSDGSWTGDGDDLGKWDIQGGEFINAKGWPFYHPFSNQTRMSDAVRWPRQWIRFLDAPRRRLSVYGPEQSSPILYENVTDTVNDGPCRFGHYTIHTIGKCL